jgi:hypothetical protein
VLENELPYAGENLDVPPGGESVVAEMDQQPQIAEQRREPGSQSALEASIISSPRSQQQPPQRPAQQPLQQGGGKRPRQPAPAVQVASLAAPPSEKKRQKLDGKERRSAGTPPDSLVPPRNKLTGTREHVFALSSSCCAPPVLHGRVSVVHHGVWVRHRPSDHGGF